MLVIGSWDFAIVEELTPRPEDLVVVKSRYSGFSGTQLDSLLRAEHIRYVFFAGMGRRMSVWNQPSGMHSAWIIGPS